jgi:acetyl-CoA C-acetyltransferase
MGGLKARGHPVGATALYQACEITLQLTGRAGRNQIRNPKVAMMQSVGGVASTILTHIFAI